MEEEPQAKQEALTPHETSLTGANPNGTEESKNKEEDEDHQMKCVTQEKFVMLQNKVRQLEGTEADVGNLKKKCEQLVGTDGHLQKRSKQSEEKPRNILSTLWQWIRGGSEKQRTKAGGCEEEAEKDNSKDKETSEPLKRGKQPKKTIDSGNKSTEEKQMTGGKHQQGRSEKQTMDPNGNGAGQAGNTNNDKDYPEQRDTLPEEVCRSNVNLSLNSSKPHLSIWGNTNRTLQFARSFEKTWDYTLKQKKDWTDDVPIALVCECTVDRHISDIQNSLKDLKEEQYYKRTIVIYIHEVVPGQKSQYQFTTVERIKMTTEGKELLEKLNYRIVDMFFNKHFEIFKDERNTEAKEEIKKFVQAYTSNI